MSKKPRDILLKGKRPFHKDKPFWVKIGATKRPEGYDYSKPEESQSRVVDGVLIWPVCYPKPENKSLYWFSQEYPSAIEHALK